MEEAKSLLQELGTKFQNRIEKQILIALNNQRKDKSSKNRICSQNTPRKRSAFQKEEYAVGGRSTQVLIYS